MEADKTFYCGVCCDDKPHRYVSETNISKLYECRTCGTAQTERKPPPPPAPRIMQLPRRRAA